MNAGDAAVDRAARHWSAQADRYHRWGDLAHAHPTYRQAWIDALAPTIGHPVRDGSAPLRTFDVGTGTGELAILLAGMGHRVSAVDLAPGMVDRARANIADAGVDVDVRQAESRALPIPDASVDLVINRMVFWALPDPVAALREWRRVLAPGGRIVVLDALHFAPPPRGDGALHHRLAVALHHRAGRVFWSLLGHLDRRRDGARDAPARPDTPGVAWRSVDEPRALFAEAELAEVRIRLLHEVAAAHRRTAAARWRLTGLLPTFHLLSWQDGA